MIRAALYHRVSTIDQNEQLARLELERAAAARGLEVVAIELETGSGANNDRPGLQRVLELARRGRVEVVLVWKLDRFGRSALDLLANIRALTNAGVRFVAVTQGIDVGPGGDAMGQLILTVLAAVAEFERELIKERTRLGMAGAKRRGVQLGRPRREVDAEKLGALRALGHSWRQIAAMAGCSPTTARRAVVELAEGRAQRAIIETNKGGSFLELVPRRGPPR